MKVLLIFVIILSWTSTLGQLHSSYTLNGVGDGPAGRTRFTSEIILNPDSSFLWISKSYNYHDKSFISSDTSRGKWTVDNGLLILDHTHQTKSPEYDKY